MIYKLTIPFEKENTREGKSYFKGNFFAYIDSSSEIRDIDVEFTSVTLDCMSTKSHWKSKSTWWRFKEELLNKWNVKHIPRPKGQNQLLRLNSEQLQNLSDQYNIWRSHKGKLTIKCIDGVISGSNSSGELQDPKHTAFSTTGVEGIVNFATIITELWNRNQDLNIKYKELSQEISMVDYFEQFTWLKPVYKAYNSSINKEQHQMIREKIVEQNLFKEYKIFLKLLKKETFIHRNKFRKNMNAVLEIISGVAAERARAELSWRNYEKAHIKPVAHIKRQLLFSWNTITLKSKESQNILKEISNPNNGIFLNPSDHKAFDTGYAFIDENLNYREDGKETFQLDFRYKTIERIQYLKYHEDNVYKKGI